MAHAVRWGILGPGRIAHKFAEGLKAVEGAELVAVGSRTMANAEKFGEEFDIPRRHGSYADLVADDQVDVVYVATPHPMHKDNTILCLRGGRAVLCEKPFAINAGEAREMIAVARECDRFLMEAMWTRFLPPIVRVRELVNQGAIGEVRMMQADFGFDGGWDPEGRLLNPHLGGGGLLDVGVYPISLASMLLGRPQAVASLAHLGETGVDEQAGMVLRYEGGRLALLACAARTNTTQEAVLLGTEGKIRLRGQWWRGSRITLDVPDKQPEDIDVPVSANGYNYQAEEVARCLAAGGKQSEIMSLDETVCVMETMDEIRAQWPLKYPME